MDLTLTNKQVDGLTVGNKIMEIVKFRSQYHVNQSVDVYVPGSLDQKPPPPETEWWYPGKILKVDNVQKKVTIQPYAVMLYGAPCVKNKLPEMLCAFDDPRILPKARKCNIYKHNILQITYYR